MNQEAQNSLAQGVLPWPITEDGGGLLAIDGWEELPGAFTLEKLLETMRPDATHLVLISGSPAILNTWRTLPRAVQMQPQAWLLVLQPVIARYFAHHPALPQLSQKTMPTLFAYQPRTQALVAVAIPRCMRPPML